MDTPLTTESANIENETTDGDDDIAMPDWLADEPAPTIANDDDLEDDAFEMPEWLSDTAPAAAAGATAFAASSEEEDTDMPDWLSDAAIDTSVTGSDTAAGGEDDDDTPDWLSDLSQGEGADNNADPEMPDWISEAAPAAVSGSSSDDIDDSGEEDASDWLSALPQAEDADEGDDGAPDWLSDLPHADEDNDDDEDGLEMPDWLSDAAPVAAVAGAAALATSNDDDDDDDDTPDWLSDLPTADDDVARARIVIILPELAAALHRDAHRAEIVASRKRVVEHDTRIRRHLLRAESHQRCALVEWHVLHESDRLDARQRGEAVHELVR
jgi:hypothetical protein